MVEINLKKLCTEKRNENSKNIDRVSTLEMIKIINSEDKKVPYSVEAELPNIAKAIDEIAIRLKKGGRLIYCGAGTSGRLGILDASECPPTYGVDHDLVHGLIAGGYEAIFKAKEGAEDSEELCIEDLKKINFSSDDVLVGLAASGRTPYVIGGLKYANSIEALTVAVTCNKNSEMKEFADITIDPEVGPEVVTGSTRMKAGTAQKLVLNMISTGVMIKMGKVYGNLMVDLKATNEKLKERAILMVSEATGVSRDKSIEVLTETEFDVKLSIVMIVTNSTMIDSKQALQNNEGYIVKAIENLNSKIKA